MINIITRDELVKEKLLYDNEVFFFKYVLIECVENYVNIIKDIDNAVLLDVKTGLIKTPFGLTDVNHLSTGCKTALNVAYVLQHPDLGYNTINVTECGDNALNVIFDMQLGDLVLLLKHKGTRGCENHDYCVNGKYMNDLRFMEA